MPAQPGFNEPFPSRDAIVKPDGTPRQVFTDWMNETLQTRLADTPFQVRKEIDLEVGVSTSGTLDTEDLGGLYRVTAYREVTAADPVSSSLDLTIAWTRDGKALTRTLSAFAGAPQTINDTTGDVAVIEIDPGTPISFTLTYASNTPGASQFLVTLIAELVNVAVQE